jgi:hypothetical protein
MVLANLKNIFSRFPLWAHNSVLGLLITDKTIVVAEIDCVNGSYRLIRSAEHISSADDILNSPGSYAADFGEFLKTNGFKSRKAVVGIQAKHLLTANIDLPTVKNESLINDIVKISFEKKLKMDLSDISFDYYLANNGSAVVLAALRKYVDGISVFLNKFAIAPLCITGISPVVALDSSKDNSCYIIVFPDHVEMMVIDSDTIKAIKQLPSTDDVDKIISVISRDITLIPDAPDKPKLCILDYSNHKSDIADKLQMGLKENGRFTVTKSSSGGTLPELAGLIAGKTVCNRNFRLDFLRGRVAEGRRRQSYRKIAPRIALGLAAFLIAAGLFSLAWYSNRAETLKLQAQLSSISAEAAKAKDIINKVNYVKQWFDTNHNYMEIFRQLTLAFPESENIWLSTMAVDDSFNQVITGKATEEKAVLDLLDSLKKNSAFEKVKILYMRKAGKTTDIITFAISFKLNKG